MKMPVVYTRPDERLSDLKQENTGSEIRRDERLFVGLVHGAVKRQPRKGDSVLSV